MINPKVLGRKIKAFSESFKVLTTTYLLRKDNEDFEFDFHSLKLPNFVVGIAIKDDQILLVDQYRFPVNKTNTEFVCGRIDHGSSADQAIKNEMFEEAGIDVKELTLLGSLHPMAGRAPNKCYVYLINEFKEVQPKREKFEELTGLRHYWLPIDDFKSKIATSYIDDGITLMAWALYLNYSELDCCGIDIDF